MHDEITCYRVSLARVARFMVRGRFRGRGVGIGDALLQ
jgi:hypothetical protein